LGGGDGGEKQRRGMRSVKGAQRKTASTRKAKDINNGENERVLTTKSGVRILRRKGEFGWVNSF